MKLIQYRRDLKITNLDQLPMGTGAGYLECIEDHLGGLIAKRWLRVLSSAAPNSVVVAF